MNSVVRAGHLAPYFKASSQVVSNGLKPAVVIHTPADRLVSQPLPSTSTVQSLHGALPIQRLKATTGVGGKFSIIINCVVLFLILVIEENLYYITPCQYIFQCQPKCVLLIRISLSRTSLRTVARRL